jgi:YesN/AraC family two-component response regulator
MYRVMIVDDELLIRETLIKLINEIGMPVEITHVLHNGREAIEALKNTATDIILTDIRMPEIDGLQLMEQISSLYTHLKIIVVSGYSDYEYMKKSIRCNAYDYLLKPVLPDELKSALSKAIAGIKIEKQNQAYYYSRRESFFQDIVLGRIKHISDIVYKCDELGIKSDWSLYRTLLISFRQLQQVASENYKSNTSFLIQQLEQNIYQIIRDYPGSFSFRAADQNKICVILYICNALKDEPDQFFEYLSTFFHNNYSLHTIAGISQSFTGIESLPKAYAQSNEAIYFNPLNGEHSCFYYGIDLKLESDMTLTLQDAVRILVQSIKFGKVQETKDATSKLLDLLRHSKTTLKNVQIVLTELLIGIKSATKLGFDRLLLHNSSLTGHEVIDSFSGYAQVEELFTSLFNELRDFIDSKDKASTTSQVMIDAEMYIQDNYYKELTLSDLASRFHFEPTYFSKLFKSTFKTNFIDYLTEIRIRKACELLSSSSFKVIDIGDLVGYPNPHHFSSVFKRITGFSPTVYREQNSNRT